MTEGQLRALPGGGLAAISLESWVAPREHDVARVLPYLSGEMIRITEKLEGSDATVKVDGRLMSADTELLVQACQRHAGPVVVDLSDLHFADDAGIRVLQELKAQGARIVGARPYVSLQLAGQDGPIGGAR